jgi:chemotaxis-related protein WspD
MTDSDSPTTVAPGLAPPAQQAAASASPELRACWSETGVHGDRTCAQLKEFVHCRNCPTYSNAGVRLLDRPLPDHYRAEWTARFSKDKGQGPQQTAGVVLFRIGVEWFALPAQAFQEVAEQRRIHSLPHRGRSLLLGLANVRGELLVCVSLGHLLGLENLPPQDELRASHHRLLVTIYEGVRLAFPADEIPCTHRLSLKDLSEPPATVAKSNPCYTKGVFQWRGHTVGFLDADLLFPALNRSLR